MSIQLSDKEMQMVQLLERSFLYIRAIASRGHCDNLSDKEKLAKIAELADASHNIPNILATGGEESPLKFLFPEIEHLIDVIRELS